MTTIRKTTESAVGARKTFVWSTPRPDSYDDIVGDITAPNLGWDLTDFNRNPICLLGHNSRDIVGRWENPRIEKSALVGDLVFAPKGASAVADEARILVECGILRATSVGFAALKSEPRGGGSSGKKYTRMVLREVSLVAIPANADALLQAKAKGVSKAMIVKIFRDQTKIARRVDKHYTAQEKAEVMRRAKALLAKSKPKSQKLPPLVSPAQRLKNEQQAYNNEVMKRALARVAVIRAERAAARRLDILARQDPPPYESDEYITWRGQKIPVSTWRGKKQW